MKPVGGDSLGWMRLMWFMLLMMGVPLQASLAGSMMVAEHAFCSAAEDEESPCCPVERSCECDCPVAAVQPVRIEEQAVVLGYSGREVYKDSGVSLTAVTRRDRPPSPPPRAA